MKFRVWLGFQLNRQDLVGYLAERALTDPGWLGDTVESLEERMAAAGASRERGDEAFTVFDQAVAEFATLVVVRREPFTPEDLAARRKS